MLYHINADVFVAVFLFCLLAVPSCILVFSLSANYSFLKCSCYDPLTFEVHHMLHWYYL